MPDSAPVDIDPFAPVTDVHLATLEAAVGEGAPHLPQLGALEQQVMDVLWDCPDELCTRRVLERLTRTTLAYTTVATVLTNLVKKGLLDRAPTPRSWAYRPVMSRSEYVAGCMLQTLRTADDRGEALRVLLADLDPTERAHLDEALKA